jgi:hypothetical protein
MKKTEEYDEPLYFNESGINFVECFEFSKEIESSDDLIYLARSLLKDNIAIAISYSKNGELFYEPTKDKLLQELRRMDKFIMPKRIYRNDEFVRLRLKSFKIKRIFEEDVDFSVEIDAILTKWGLGICCVSIWLGEDRNNDYIVNVVRLIKEKLPLKLDIQFQKNNKILKQSLFDAINSIKTKFKKYIYKQFGLDLNKKIISFDHVCIECQSLSKKYHPDFNGSPLDLLEKYPKQIVCKCIF